MPLELQMMGKLASQTALRRDSEMEDGNTWNKTMEMQTAIFKVYSSLSETEY